MKTSSSDPSTSCCPRGFMKLDEYARIKWERARDLRKRGKYREAEKELKEALEEEMNHELGYSKYDYRSKQTKNSRNEHLKKTVKSKHGKVELDIPRDLNGDFEPVIIPKHQRTLTSDLADRIIGLYAKGMSNRDINDQLKYLYKIDVSAEMVSKITDRVIPIAKESYQQCCGYFTACKKRSEYT